MNGDVWSVGAGSVARLFMGRTPGYFQHPGTDGTLTPKDIAQHLDQIRDPAGFSEPVDWPSEWQSVVDLFAQ